MISVEIPNDIAEYKPKLLLGLTGRQVALVILTAGAIFLDMTFLKPYIGETLAVFVAAIPAFLAAAFGWKEPYGMPFEKFLQSVFIQAFVAPRVRKNKTVSPLVVPCDKYFEPIPDEALSADLLECVNYVRQKTGIETTETPTGQSKTIRRRAKKVKKKYVKSRLAML